MVSIAGHVNTGLSTSRLPSVSSLSGGLTTVSTPTVDANRAASVNRLASVGRLTSLNQLNATTNNSIETGLQRASEQNAQYLNDAKALYEPYAQTGASSLDEYTRLLLGGIDGLSDDQNLQDMRNLGERKVMATRAVSGLLRSGATASALYDADLRFMNDYYGNRLNQLRTGVSIGENAISSQDSILQKLGVNATDLASALANIKMQRESNDAMIQAAQAQAGATTSAANKTAKSNMWGSIAGAVGTGLAIAALASDRRLKTDLRLVGKSNNGLNIYLGRYTKESGLDDGKEHLFLIAQEVRDVVPEAVIEGEDGYLRVDYAKALGV